MKLSPPAFFILTGRSYAVSSQRMLHQCLESIVQKVQSGVVINFEKIGPDPPSLESDNVDNKPNGGKGKFANNQNDLFINRTD